MNALAQELCDIDNAQGIGLDPTLALRLRSVAHSSMRFPDSSIIHSIAHALMETPFRASERPVEGDCLNGSFSSRIARQLIDSPHRPLPEGIVSFTSYHGWRIEACEDAEKGFGRTFEGILSSSPKKGPKFEVFTHQRVPYFVRKAYNKVPSAISLQGLAINGVLLPIGSIVRIDTARDIRKRDPQSPRGHSFVGLDTIREIAFQRHSDFSIEGTAQHEQLIAARTALRSMMEAAPIPSSLSAEFILPVPMMV